jgi:hypothetical protein
MIENEVAKIEEKWDKTLKSRKLPETDEEWEKELEPYAGWMKGWYYKVGLFMLRYGYIFIIGFIIGLYIGHGLVHGD